MLGSEIRQPTNRVSNALDSRWYVVYCKPRRELLAGENLERQGFESYCPLIQCSRRRNGTLVSFIVPFFPRYLFVRFDHGSDDWSPIRSTRGVIGLVKFAGVPQAVPEQLIQSLQSNENPEQLQASPTKTWKNGDVVSIEEGPFAGYSCIYKAAKSHDRVRVLLNIIGEQTLATLHKNDLELPEHA